MEAKAQKSRKINIRADEHIKRRVKRFVSFDLHMKTFTGTGRTENNENLTYEGKLCKVKAEVSVRYFVLGR